MFSKSEFENELKYALTKDYCNYLCMRLPFLSVETTKNEPLIGHHRPPSAASYSRQWIALPNSQLRGVRNNRLHLWVILVSLTRYFNAILMVLM